MGVAQNNTDMEEGSLEIGMAFRESKVVDFSGLPLKESVPLQICCYGCITDIMDCAPDYLSDTLSSRKIYS